MKAEQLRRTTAVVKGRCVDGRTKAPLAGVTVKFDGWGRNSAAMAQHGKVKWQDPAPVVTREDGTFAIRFVPPPPYQHSIDLAKDGYYPRTGRWGAFTPGQVEDLGDVPFFPGFKVRGKVVDQTGKPVAGVSVGFRNLCLPIGMEPGAVKPNVVFGAASGRSKHFSANSTRHGRSQQDGTFVSRVDLPVGTWPLAVNSRGRTLVGPKEVTVPADGKLAPITVTIEQQPSISGILVDDAGKPVSRAYVKARQTRSGRMASAYTRRDGTWRIFRTAAVDQKAVAIVVSNIRGCEIPPSTTPVAWGTTGVKIIARRALSFPLRVVEAGSDRPITKYSVVCHPSGATSSRQIDPRLGGEHKDGKVVVDSVPRGKNILLVIPNDQRYRVSETRIFTATAQHPGPAKIEVQRLTPLKVVVRDSRGEPVKRTQVELIVEGNGLFHPTSVAPRGHQRTWSTDPNFKAAELLFSTKTDDLGQCIVYGLPGNEEMVLRVGGQGEASTVHRGVQVGPKHLRFDVKLD